MQSANPIEQSNMLALALLQNRSLPVIYLLVMTGLMAFVIWATREAIYHFLWRRKKYTPHEASQYANRVMWVGIVLGAIYLILVVILAR